MASVARSKRWTFEDFCALIREDQKADLINGAIYMASPENTEANKLFLWLIILINQFVETQELGGQVFGSRVAFRINEDNSPEPDIAYVSKERLRRVHPGRVEGAPDLAVEIVSPDSIERDYVKKRELYRSAGVREYWIVDDLEEKVLLLRLGTDKKYREVRPRKGALHSQVLPGFWLRPEWLWQNPRPKLIDVLNQLLAPEA